MSLLKQSQTAQPLVFRMVDSTDHVTPKTGLSPTVTLSKNGGAFASPAGAVTEIANGFYKVAGNATDAATLGPLLLHATGAAADPASAQFEVVAFDPQTGWLSPTVAGRTVDVTATGAVGIDWANVENPTTEVHLNSTTIGEVIVVGEGAITSLSIDPTALAAIANDVWIVLTSAVTLAGSFGKLMKDNLNATVSSRLGPTVSGRTLDVTATGATGIDLANVENQASPLLLSNTTINAVNSALGMDAEVVTEIAAQVNAFPAASIIAAGSIGKLTKDTLTNLGTAMALDGAVYRFTSNALELAPVSGGSSASEIAAVVETTLAAAHGAGSWATVSSGLTPPQESQLLYVATEVAKIPRLGSTFRWTNVGTGRDHDDIIHSEVPPP